MAEKISSGYEGEFADDFSIPEANIEDMDRALFDLFDKRLGFQIKVNDQAKKVPVVFSTGERFALTRRKSPIRDRNNTLILPIISIHRNSIDTSPSQNGYGSPISFRDQQSYTIRKRLSKKDRDYQKVINKLGLQNQKNVASDNNIMVPGPPARISKAGTVASRRAAGAAASTTEGYLLKNQIGNNIFEIITLPYPTFFTSNYEITFWTQYMSQMNQIIETMLALTDGQDYGFKMISKAGYEYVAYIKNPLTSADNFSDFSSDERIIKYTFSMSVPGYLLATDHIGMPSPFRKFYSAPQIEFGYFTSSTQVVKRAESPSGESIGSSEEETGQNSLILSEVDQEDGDNTGPGTRGEGDVELVEDTIVNPFNTTEREVFHYRTGERVTEGTTEKVKVLTRNERAGETVASSIIVVDVETTLDTVDD